ncbi:MAG: putative transcriptional regulator [Psychromonas sp.]|jgi:predicted transcriptional regulator
MPPAARLEYSRFNVIQRSNTKEMSNRMKKQPGCSIAENFMFYYKADNFFYVNKDTKGLHDIILNGLINAYNTGDFMKYFNWHPDIQEGLNFVNNFKGNIYPIENLF